MVLAYLFFVLVVVAGVSSFALFGLLGGTLACLVMYAAIALSTRFVRRFIGNPLAVYDRERR